MMSKQRREPRCHRARLAVELRHLLAVAFLNAVCFSEFVLQEFILDVLGLHVPEELQLHRLHGLSGAHERLAEPLVFKQRCPNVCAAIACVNAYGHRSPVRHRLCVACRAFVFELNDSASNRTLVAWSGYTRAYACMVQMLTAQAV